MKRIEKGFIIGIYIFWLLLSLIYFLFFDDVGTEHTTIEATIIEVIHKTNNDSCYDEDGNHHLNSNYKQTHEVVLLLEDGKKFKYDLYMTYGEWELVDGNEGKKVLCDGWYNYTRLLPKKYHVNEIVELIE